MPNEEKKVTSASEIRAKAQGMIVDLPSGITVRVRRTMDILVMLRAGKIPNPLAGIVQEMLQQKRPGINPQDLDPEAFNQLIDLVDQTTVRVMLEPRVEIPDDIDDPTWEPSEGAIGVNDLSLEDKFFLFSLAQGGASDLASFREEQIKALDAAQNGEGVQRPTKRTARAGK